MFMGQNFNEMIKEYDFDKKSQLGQGIIFLNYLKNNKTKEVLLQYIWSLIKKQISKDQ